MVSEMLVRREFGVSAERVGRNKLVKFCLKPAKRGDSIKPGVERSETPGSFDEKEEPAKRGDNPSSRGVTVRQSYRTLRALCSLRFFSLGFRFAPPQTSCFSPLRGLGTFRLIF